MQRPRKLRTYYYSGEAFFASAERFTEAMDFKEIIDKVVIDVSAAHFWDISAVGMLDKAIIKLRRARPAIEIVGLNEPSAALLHRFGVREKLGASLMSEGNGGFEIDKILE